MIDLSVNVGIIESTTSKKGRIIPLKARFQVMKFIFVNNFAPNDLAQQVKCFDCLKSELVKCATENIIVGGVFNEN